MLLKRALFGRAGWVCFCFYFSLTVGVVSDEEIPSILLPVSAEGRGGWRVSIPSLIPSSKRGVDMPEVLCWLC